MKGLNVSLHADRMVGIPHPGDFADATAVEAWAAAEAEKLEAAVEGRPAPEFVRSLADLLVAAVGKADGSETLVVLVVDAETGFWTVARFGMQEAPLRQSQVDEFIRPKALLPPRLVGFETEGLGQGLMSTFVRAEPERIELAYARWCFSNAAGAVIVQTDAMPLSWLATLLDTLIDLIMSTVPDGLEGPRGVPFGQIPPNFAVPERQLEVWDDLPDPEIESDADAANGD